MQRQIKLLKVKHWNQASSKDLLWIANGGVWANYKVHYIRHFCLELVCINSDYFATVLWLAFITCCYAQGCESKLLGKMDFEVDGCVGEVGKHYGMGLWVGIQPLLGHCLPSFKVNTPDSSICRIMRFARLKPMQNFSLMPDAVTLFCPCAYAKTSSNRGSQLLLSKVLFSIVVLYIYGLQFC